MRDDVKAFFAARGSGSVVRLDLVQACIDFRAAQSGNLARWIARIGAGGL
jgi:hypothetical protein